MLSYKQAKSDGLAVTLALLATGLWLPAQASVIYGIKGHAQATARFDGGTGTVQTNHLGDANGQPLNGFSGMLTDPLTVRGGVTAQAQDGPLTAGALAGAAGYGGGLLTRVTSGFQGTPDPRNRATGEADATATMLFKNTISGVAGTAGRLAFTGSTPVNLSAGSDVGTVSFRAGMSLQAYAPDQLGCAPFDPACIATLQYGRTYGAGTTVIGDILWRLELEVEAGDLLDFIYTLNTHGSAGGGGSVGSIGPAPEPGAPADVGGADDLMAVVADGLAAPSPASSAADSGLRIWLSDGLELMNMEGLVRFADGSYGFGVAAPGLVAEPPMLMLMLVSLVAGLRASPPWGFRRQRSPQPWRPAACASMQTDKLN